MEWESVPFWQRSQRSGRLHQRTFAVLSYKSRGMDGYLCWLRPREANCRACPFRLTGPEIQYIVNHPIGAEAFVVEAPFVDLINSLKRLGVQFPKQVYLHWRRACTRGLYRIWRFPCKGFTWRTRTITLHVTIHADHYVTHQELRENPRE